MNTIKKWKTVSSFSSLILHSVSFLLWRKIITGSRPNTLRVFLMGRSGYPNKQGNWGGGGSPCKSRSLNFGDIQKVRSLKIPDFWPPSPLFALVHFREATPLPPQGTFVLARTHPLPSVFILVKFRENKLIMSTSIFGWTQHVF